MYLLVIRHAAAMDKEEFARTGRSDDERPLTPAGKKEMARVARGLRALVPKLDAVMVHEPGLAETAVEYLREQDRKSTRLNSSHSSPSRMPSSA